MTVNKVNNKRGRRYWYRATSLLLLVLCVSGIIRAIDRVRKVPQPPKPPVSSLSAPQAPPLAVPVPSPAATATSQPQATTIPTPPRDDDEKTQPLACRIPQLSLYNPVIERFFKAEVTPLNCTDGQPNWVHVSNGKFYINWDMVGRIGPISCVSRPFWFKPEKSGELGYGDYKVITDGQALKKDFITVRCNTNDDVSYHQAFATVVPTKIKKPTGKRATEKPLLNVIIIAIDSVSRLQFIRKLPKTYEYLTKKLMSVPMTGYNIVGDGTQNNLLPLLTGHYENEMPTARREYGKDDQDPVSLDKLPWIWKKFKQRGYKTMWGEESWGLGSFFRLRGFERQPVDHYFNPFWQLVRQGEPKQNGENEPFTNDECLGNETDFAVFLRYIEDMLTVYPKSIGKFAFLIYDHLSHDDLNTIQLIDDDFTNALHRWHSSGLLNESLLVVMSDHGPRSSTKFRRTQQGVLEERLAMMSFAAPQWFRTGIGARAWSNMMVNAQAILCTPFDVHETLVDLLRWEKINFVDQIDDGERGLSLWLKHPRNRTCYDAGIAEHYCTCLAWKKVSTKDTIVQRVAQHVVNAINRITEPWRGNCVLHNLTNVLNAKHMQPNDKLMSYRDTENTASATDVPQFDVKRTVSNVVWQVQVRTLAQSVPAVYEATVGYNKRTQTLEPVNMDNLSRINRYGKQSRCMVQQNRSLMKFCVCRDFLAKQAKKLLEKVDQTNGKKSKPKKKNRKKKARNDDDIDENNTGD